MCAHLPRYPCCQHKRSPWQRCIRALSSRSGRHTASCSDPVCISRYRCTNQGSHLVGETERMRRRDMRLRQGSGEAMQGGARSQGSHWASLTVGPVPAFQRNGGSRSGKATHAGARRSGGTDAGTSQQPLTWVQGSEQLSPSGEFSAHPRPGCQIS